MNSWWKIVTGSMEKFRPDFQAKNPVMFVTEIAFIVSIFVIIFPTEFDIQTTGNYVDFYIAVTVLLFLTLLFSNISTTVSEEQSRSITDSLKRMKTETTARKVSGATFETVTSDDLRTGDTVVVDAGEIIPGDGEIISGSGYVNESNITGESRAVRKLEGDSVTGSTKLMTDKITVRITANPGETYIDRMIQIVETAVREKTPNEIALSTLLSGLTLIFLMITASIFALSRYLGININIDTLIVLLIALIPTTIGGLMPAVGIAAVNKISKFNVISKSGRAVENAGDVDTIILDKTGTVTMGDREAIKFYPNSGIDENEFIRYCAMASLQDKTMEGISIVNLAKEKGVNVTEADLDGFKFLPFSAETRFSGIKAEDTYVYKGALSTLLKNYNLNDTFTIALCKEISLRGGTALPVVKDGKFIGVIELNDTLKPGIKQRLELLKKMNIHTIMCTGDDEVTASYFTNLSGIDNYVANSTPEDKYNVVISEKEKQRMVAMVGDGTNDAPALAKADVGMAMNKGTTPAKDAANMIDLDSDPTKLMDVIFIGKQILITRGALTTFSIANDVSKYFVVIPAMFSLIPELGLLNILGLSNPLLAITSALIFNTIIIPILVPMAIRGVKYRPSSITELFRRNILIYGIGGVILPFLAIKAIYVLLTLMGVVW
ncbi:MAG: potassium-transporting ATPase subunit KdpB [Thermoplasmataceae archaeon]